LILIFAQKKKCSYFYHTNSNIVFSLGINRS
jgi:hypothetical protein